MAAMIDHATYLPNTIPEKIRAPNHLFDLNFSRQSLPPHQLTTPTLSRMTHSPGLRKVSTGNLPSQMSSAKRSCGIKRPLEPYSVSIKRRRSLKARLPAAAPEQPIPATVNPANPASTGFVYSAIPRAEDITPAFSSSFLSWRHQTQHRWW